MAELRNSYGSGHGKDAKFKGLSPRHARLAVGDGVIVVHFPRGGNGFILPCLSSSEMANKKPVFMRVCEPKKHFAFRQIGRAHV